jgi:hypothetical protein
MRKIILILIITLLVGNSFVFPQERGEKNFLDTLQMRSIKYFLDCSDKKTGLVPDRGPVESVASVAAMGFALVVYPIAHEREMISRDEAADRVLNTLEFLYNSPQNKDKVNTTGYEGFYYHFLDMKKGLRTWNCELSTIDTGLLMGGVLFCASYFNADTKQEKRIRELADILYKRVNWKWASNNKGGIWLGWDPVNGFDPMDWKGYNEAMILYILALGSPTMPVQKESWNHWTSNYVWANYYGQEFVSFAPLFGHQFSHLFIDFKGIQDEFMQKKGIDYFENSRRATYAQRNYFIKNPKKFNDYSENIWGLTACDGPKDTTLLVNGNKVKFEYYAARGVSIDWSNDDGTIAPTAVGGSVVFAPEICIPALKAIKEKYGDNVFRDYGFVDAFNPSFITDKTPNGWFGKDYLGIDQGPIIIMIENFRTGLVWKTLKKNPYIISGLKKAGFTGGWLE